MKQVFFKVFFIHLHIYFYLKAKVIERMRKLLIYLFSTQTATLVTTWPG